MFIFGQYLNEDHRKKNDICKSHFLSVTKDSFKTQCNEIKYIFLAHS